MPHTAEAIFIILKPTPTTPAQLGTPSAIAEAEPDVRRDGMGQVYDAEFMRRTEFERVATSALLLRCASAIADGMSIARV